MTCDMHPRKQILKMPEKESPFKELIGLITKMNNNRFRLMSYNFDIGVSQN